MRRTWVLRRSDEGEAQRRRWTFYEAVKYTNLIHKSGGGTVEHEGGCCICHGWGYSEWA